MSCSSKNFGHYKDTDIIYSGAPFVCGNVKVNNGDTLLKVINAIRKCRSEEECNDSIVEFGFDGDNIVIVVEDGTTFSIDKQDFVEWLDIDEFELFHEDTEDILLFGKGVEGDELKAELRQEIKDDISQGVTAYGWGDHSNAGYAFQKYVIEVSNEETISIDWLEPRLDLDGGSLADFYGRFPKIELWQKSGNDFYQVQGNISMSESNGQANEITIELNSLETIILIS